MNEIGKWRSRLNEFDSASHIRRFMTEYNGGFEVESLTSLVIIGAASEGRRLIKLCKGLGIKVISVVDDNEALVGTSIDDVAVMGSESLEDLDKSIPVIIASHRTVDVTIRVRRQGFRTVLPFMALQALAPDKFPPHMFYEGILEALVTDRRRIGDVASYLADVKSEAVLDAAIGYRLTADPEVFVPTLDTFPYFLDELFAPAGPAVYVDGGAYDGDSVGWFVDRWGDDLEKVFAFEPDPNTFKALQENFQHESRVTSVNKGVYSCETTLKFLADGTRGALFDEAGDQSISVTSIDTVLNGSRVDFIKLNIEGSEIDAIWGAEKTIRNHKPSMCISAYHHPCDLWRIADLVSSMEPDYDIFMRQHDGGIIETVVYTRLKSN